jgi:hypothetical protein
MRREETERCDLVQVGLRRGHGLFVAGGEWQHGLGNAREVGFRVVRQRNGEGAVRTSPVEIRDHVGGAPGLREADCGRSGHVEGRPVVDGQ